MARVSLEATRPGSTFLKGSKIGTLAAMLIACLNGVEAMSNSAPVRHKGLECNQIMATGHPEYPPYSIRSGDKLTGIGPNLVQRMGETLGVPISTTYGGSWKRAQMQTADGRFDMIVALYKTSVREGDYSFIGPIGTDNTVIIQLDPRKKTITSLMELEKMRGVAVLGEAFGDRLDMILADRLNVRRVPSVQHLANALIFGRADYALHGATAFKHGLTQLPPQPKNLVFSIVPVQMPSVFIAVSKKSSCISLVDRLNSSLSMVTEKDRKRLPPSGPQ